MKNLKQLILGTILLGLLTPLFASIESETPRMNVREATELRITPPLDVLPFLSVNTFGGCPGGYVIYGNSTKTVQNVSERIANFTALFEGRHGFSYLRVKELLLMGTSWNFTTSNVAAQTCFCNITGTPTAITNEQGKFVITYNVLGQYRCGGNQQEIGKLKVTAEIGANKNAALNFSNLTHCTKPDEQKNEYICKSS